MVSSQDIGQWGEVYVKNRLSDLGWQILPESQADVSAVSPETGEIVKIEVKTARRGKDGKFRATTYKRGHTDHNKADIVVLICQHTELTFFVIPSQAVKNHIAITSNPRTYEGKWSKYRRHNLIIRH